MVECVVLCLDNSEWMRNGDYPPTRFESQLDAAHFLAGYTSTANQENSVAIVSMGGFRVEIRINPTNDIGKLLAAVHGIKLDGSSDFIRGLQTAQLVLKHRFDKRQEQRIVCFVGSPVLVSEKQLVMLGKNLRKNNISLDLISFGDIELNKDKLKKLYQAVNNSDTSTYLECPPYSDVSIRDVLLNSPLVRNNQTAAGVTTADGVEGSGGVVNEFGVDPAADPELYMALRMSLVEQEARQEELKTREDTAGNEKPGDVLSTNVEAALEEERGVSSLPADRPKAALASAIEETVEEDVEMQPSDEFFAPSVKETPITPLVPSRPNLFADPLYMESLLEQLGGVDMQDPRIQEMLQKAGVSENASTDEKNAKNEEKKKDCEENERSK